MTCIVESSSAQPALTAKRFYKTVYNSYPWGFVLSRNLHRRHLGESQRALVAARLGDDAAGRTNGPGTFGKFTEG